MIVIGCSCGQGPGNTGTLTCTQLFGLTVGVGIMETLDADFALNGFPLNTTKAVLAAAFLASLTAADATQRQYPVTDLREVEFPKEETVTKTDSTGQSVKIRDGVQQFTAQEWEVSPVYVSKVKQSECGDRSVWYYTTEGVIGLKRDNAGVPTWYPLSVKAFDANFAPAFADNPQMMKLAFNQAIAISAGELWLVSWGDLELTIESMTGLKDANFIETVAPVVDSPGIGTTEANFRLDHDYGDGVVGAQLIPGQVAGDFLLHNNTTGLDVALTAVAENAGVDYNFQWLNETATDSLTLSIITASGYEGEVTFLQP